MATQSKTKLRGQYYVKFYRAQLIYLILLALTIYILLPQLGQFKNSYDVLQAADLQWLPVAFGAVFLAIASGSATYKCLQLQSFRYGAIWLVQWAGMFVNRLLPAGIGGIGLTADFLYRHKHTAPQVAAVVAMNNLLTFGGHMLLLVTAGLAFEIDLPNTPPAKTLLIIAGVLALVAIALALKVQITNRLKQFGIMLLQAFIMYKSRLLHLMAGLAFAMANTSCHVLALWCGLQAFAINLPLYTALIVLTGGVALASVTPTPGGIGGAEAGLTAGFVSYGVGPETALAAALSYRLVSYWLPLLPGVAALYLARQRRLI